MDRETVTILKNLIMRYANKISVNTILISMLIFCSAYSHLRISNLKNYYAKKYHNHDYAEKYHKHDYAEERHDHDYAEERHDHYYDYAKKYHTHF